MDYLEQWRSILTRVLEYYANIPCRYGDVKSYLVISQDRNHYLLLREGWYQQNRMHGMIVHAEFRDDKIWIHYDGIEDSITVELVERGIPKDCIVLAFQPPALRQYTEYAIA